LSKKSKKIGINETPRRKQRGIVSGITLFFSPQAAGNLPLEIKRVDRQITVNPLF